MVRKWTRECEALQESVNALTQPCQAQGLAGLDAQNDPPLNTSETGNTGTSTTPITKNASAEPAEDGNVTNVTAVKTSNIKGSGRDDSPDDQKEPPKKSWKPPKLPKMPKPPPMERIHPVAVVETAATVETAVAAMDHLVRRKETQDGWPHGQTPWEGSLGW